MGTDGGVPPAKMEQNHIDLPVVDRTTGKPKGRARLRATIISPKEKVQKQEQNVPAPTKLDDHNTYAPKDQPIPPPYNLSWLASLPENSTELSQNIRAMVTNTIGFGWQLKERPMSEETREKFAAEIEAEKAELSARLQSVHATESLKSLREKVGFDKHAVGNGYLELIDNMRGELVGMAHVRGHTVRMVEIDEEATLIRLPIVRPDKGFAIEEIPMWHRFRRFVIKRNNGKSIWFKEAGDPRVLNKETGEYADDTLPLGQRATALIHNSVYNILSIYGVPLYIGTSVGLAGSREAEEINFNGISNNMIPSMFVMIDNGALTEGSIDRLNDWVENNVAKAKNRSAFILLEGESLEEASLDPGKFSIKVEPLKSLQTDDAMYQQYDKNNKEKTRESFRMPPIFVGRCHSEDTQFLTSEGWKFAPEINEDEEKLATMNTETGALEYQHPTARHQYQYDGELLHMKNRGIDALVTPNHKMWTRPSTASAYLEKEWEFVEAQDLNDIRGKLGGCVELPVSADWEGSEKETFTIPAGYRKNMWDPSKPSKNRSRDIERHERGIAKYEPRDVSMGVFLQFLGYFVSEGSTTKMRGPVVLSQNDGEIADEMISCVRELGFEPSIVESRKGQLNIGICHVGLWEWLRENCGVRSKNKKLPRWVLDLPPRQIEIVLNALIDGDGSVNPNGSAGSFTYSTTSKVLNDQLHEMCLRLGIALITRELDRSAKGWALIYCSSGTIKHRHLLQTAKQIKRVAYSGKVHCFTTPNGMLVTRRNGRVLISGNSSDYSRAVADTSRDIGDEQVFAPERADNDEKINRNVIMRWRARFHVFQSNHPNITDDLELIRMAAIAERSGGMTPRRMDRVMQDIFGEDLGPLPKGIDPDVPFSITFASAQAQAVPMEPGDDTDVPAEGEGNARVPDAATKRAVLKRYQKAVEFVLQEIDEEVNRRRGE